MSERNYEIPLPGVLSTFCNPCLQGRIEHLLQVARWHTTLNRSGHRVIGVNPCAHAICVEFHFYGTRVPVFGWLPNSGCLQHSLLPGGLCRQCRVLHGLGYGLLKLQVHASDQAGSIE